MSSTIDTGEHVREPEAPSAHRLSIPPSRFALMVQVALDNLQLRDSDPDLQREADLAQRARRETAEMLACDPDLQLEAELAQPRLFVEALEVELDLYYAFDPDLEVDMLVIYGNTDEQLDDPWFDSFDPDDDAWPSSFDPDVAN